MALSFEEDLQNLLNRHSAESPSGTPDYILAEMMTGMLKTYNEAVVKRAEWRGESVDPPSMTRLFAATPTELDAMEGVSDIQDGHACDGSVLCDCTSPDDRDNDRFDGDAQSDEVEATFAGGGDIHIHIEAPKPAEYSFFQSLIGEQTRNRGKDS